MNFMAPKTVYTWTKFRVQYTCMRMCIFFKIIFVVNLAFTKLSVCISAIIFYHAFNSYVFFIYICLRNRALRWIMSRSNKSTAWSTWCDVTPGPERSDRYREIRSRPVDQETVIVSHIYVYPMFSIISIFVPYSCLHVCEILAKITCNNKLSVGIGMG